MLFRELCGGLFAVADINDQAPFCLNCFEPQKRHFLCAKAVFRGYLGLFFCGFRWDILHVLGLAR